MDPQRDAAARLNLILQRLKGQTIDRIPLTLYEDRETYEFLCGAPQGGNWTFDHWRAVNAEVGRGLQRHGYRVTFIPVRLADYIDWLTATGKKNTSATRAEYIARASAQPQPPPRPPA